MPRNFDRSDRIANQIKKEISTLLKFKVKDPLLQETVTITDCEVSKDYMFAKVYYTVFSLNQDENLRTKVEHALKRANGFLRSSLAQKLTIRNVPQLSFKYDSSFDYGQKMDNLFEKLKKEQQTDE